MSETYKIFYKTKDKLTDINNIIEGIEKGLRVLGSPIKMKLYERDNNSQDHTIIITLSTPKTETLK